MTCQFSPNTTLVANVTFGIFTASQADNITCPSTYLRPDPGGALIPWLYTLFLLLFHLPACVLRVVRWQSAQYLSLALASLSIALCIQSYISTGLVAEEVLVWMPLTLMLDVGAMLQMVVLLIEKRRGPGRGMAIALQKSVKELGEALGTFGAKASGEETQERHGLMDNGNGVTQSSEQTAAAQPSEEETQESHELTDNRNRATQTSEQALTAQASGEGTQNRHELRNNGNGVTQTAEQTRAARSAAAEARKEAEREDLADGMTCIAAFTLGLTLFILQIYGLDAAVKAMHKSASTPLTVKWCSPSFRDFALAITTGNCDIYPVAESSSNGIGCISLPARQQRDWLISTVAVLGTTLAIEVIDMLMMRVGRGRTCRGKVEMNRPWLCMSFGVLSLVILVAFGIFHAARLPPGVTDVVWIFRKDPLATVGRVCHVNLKAPGLRGMIIGWSDGLFAGWGYVYQGGTAAG